MRILYVENIISYYLGFQFLDVSTLITYDGAYNLLIPLDCVYAISVKLLSNINCERANPIAEH